ncbi:hypothetical protein [Streptomyces uncialis]|uniref:hypothetical protein n=1 Tax=Streptomyces uncialis TaxID=1048205 RepID=UPI000AF1ED19|nr:hypothetical protein [Streptomyces uncialis]
MPVPRPGLRPEEERVRRPRDRHTLRTLPAPGPGDPHRRHTEDKAPAMLSYQELIVPRDGPVNPDTCPQCASLRNAMRSTLDRSDTGALMVVVEMMDLHRKRGHPRGTVH